VCEGWGAEGATVTFAAGVGCVRVPGLALAGWWGRFGRLGRGSGRRRRGLDEAVGSGAGIESIGAQLPGEGCQR